MEVYIEHKDFNSFIIVFVVVVVAVAVATNNHSCKEIITDFNIDFMV